MTFICQECGIEFEGRPGQTYRLFCSKKCLRKAKNRRKTFPCPHNDGVECDQKQCYRCGWNPDVEKRRKEKIRQRRKESLAR